MIAEVDEQPGTGDPTEPQLGQMILGWGRLG
jgi:hypothetical protein